MRIVSVARWLARAGGIGSRWSGDHSPARASGEMSSASLVAPVAVARRARVARLALGVARARIRAFPDDAPIGTRTITPAISVCARLPPPTTKTPCP